MEAKQEMQWLMIDLIKDADDFLLDKPTHACKSLLYQILCKIL